MACISATTEDTPAQSVPGTPERQPSGRWEPVYELGTITDWRCGSCGKIVYSDILTVHYCPHCGAAFWQLPRKKIDAEFHHDPRYSYLEKIAYSGPVKIKKPKRQTNPARC